MRLYFLRHAEAEEGTDDAKRRLTVRGKRDARRMGRFLRKAGVEFDRAFTSPLVRARQTAELALAECPLRKGAALEEAMELLNDGSAATFDRWLATLPEVGAVLLVGHEPSLSARVRRLVRLDLPAALPLTKGAVACVKTEDRKGGTLKLLVAPKHLG